MSLLNEVVSNMLKENGQCTFMKSGLQLQYQSVYFCHDCNPTMNETYCEHCAKKCHYNHHVTKAKNLKTYCFCGKKMHQLAPPSIESQTKSCTFWELDDKAKVITGNNTVFHCDLCKIRFCSFCVYFCHFHHIEKMEKTRSDSREEKCGCENICHKDDRHLYYVMKNFSIFRLENLFNTHMLNILLESPNTCSKLFGFYMKNIKQLSEDIIANRFKWNRELIYSHSSFSRSLMCLFDCVRNVKLYHFSAKIDEIIPPRLILEICLDDSYDNKYEVRIIKKNMLYLLHKLQLIPDFQKVTNKYTTKDYANINCIQRLNVYCAVRNDKALKMKYFNESYNFRMQTIRILEKYSNICRVDDHLSMALFATIVNIIKLLMQYGVYNIMQIKMIADIIEMLLRILKLENISKSNEEYKEMIFKNLPSLLYIMTYTYNDYVFLENLLYENVQFKEFTIGKSNFGAKILSSVFLANIKYILKYVNSQKCTKIIQLTYKTLAMLTSENDNYLKTLFNVDKDELIEFITYYDVLTDANYNNNYPFLFKLSEMISGEILFIKRFPNLQITNLNIAKQIIAVNAAKVNIEEEYLRYFCLKSDIYELTNKIIKNLDGFRKLTENATKKAEASTSVMNHFISLLSIADKSRHIKLNLTDKKEDYSDDNVSKVISKKSTENSKMSEENGSDWTVANAQLVINKTGFHFSVIKLLKITYLQADAIAETNFEKIVQFFEFYAKDSVSNTINVLSSSYLKYFFYYINRFPHIILKMVYKMLRHLTLRNFKISDYTYIYDNLRNAFNCRFSKINDPEKYIEGFLYNIKCLKMIKRYLPNNLVNDMRIRIQEFLMKLHKNETVMKEYLWINNFKKRLLMKDSENMNGIKLGEYIEDFDKTKRIPKSENDKMLTYSANHKRKLRLKDAQNKQNQIYQKKSYSKNKNPSNKCQSRWLMDNDSQSGYFDNNNDTLKISRDSSLERFGDDSISYTNFKPELIIDNIDQGDIIDNPSFISDLNIENETVINDHKTINKIDSQDEFRKNENKEYKKRNGDDVMPYKIVKLGLSLDNILDFDDNPFNNQDVNVVLEDANQKNPSDNQELSGNFPSINEQNFESSAIKITEDLHHQIQDQHNKESDLKILQPIEKPDNTFYNSELGLSDIFDNPLLKNLDQDKKIHEMKNNTKYHNNFETDFTIGVDFDESENKIQENQIFTSFIDDISPDLFENKKQRHKKLTKNKRELGRLKKLKTEERKQELLDKLLTSNNTSKAFVKILELLNEYTEDFVSDELQEILRRYFPRTEIKKILEQKRYLKNLKMRTQLIKMMRINYLNTSISKDKSYFDLFYLDQYEFFIKLYEQSSSNKKSNNQLGDITKIASILINELSNFVEIVRPFCDRMKTSDLIKTEKTKKYIRLYITEGILATVKQFADKVYSHGQNITGEELCQTFRVIFYFDQIKSILDALLEDRNLEVALSIQKKNEMEDNQLELLFDQLNGGIENFNRNSLFSYLYRILNSSLQTANPNYKKSLDDVWATLNQKMNGTDNYAGYDFLPDYLDLAKSANKQHLNVDNLVVNEFSRICKFYLNQSKNFKQSSLLACFNCVIHESNFDYRETFTKFFLLSYSNDKLKESGENNNMLEIMNKCIEYDHFKLHPILLKNFLEEEKKGNQSFLNEINRQLLYNSITLLLYINRREAYKIWEHSNYNSCVIVKFFQLLAKNPTTSLHEYIIQHAHENKSSMYNFFFIMEALMNKIIKLSKWGKEYDLKNEKFFDNMFVLFHNLVNCFADHAREADEENIVLIFARIKSLVYAFKRILFFEPADDDKIAVELKLSILHLISSLLEEGKGSKIIPEISHYFDPFKIFKLCVWNFLNLVKKLPRNDLNELKVQDTNNIKLNLDYSLPHLIKIYQNEESFTNSSILVLCYKMFSFMRILKDTYKEPNAIKSFYAIKRFKNTKKGPHVNNYMKRQTNTDYKFLYQSGTTADAFLEMDEVNETEYVIYKFLKQTIGVIEIYSYRKKLEYIYFPRIPLTYCIRQNSSKEYLEFNDRESSTNKAQSLVNYIQFALEEGFYNYHLRESNKMLYTMTFINFQVFKFILFIINFLSCILSWIWLDTNTNSINQLATFFDVINFLASSALLIIWSATRFYPKYKHNTYLYLISNKKSLDYAPNFIQVAKLILIDVLFSNFDFLYLSYTSTIGFFCLVYKLTSLRFLQLTSFVFVSSYLSKMLRFIGRNWLQFFLLIFTCFILLGTATAFTHDYYYNFAINSGLLDVTNGAQLTGKSFCNTFSSCLFYYLFYGMRYDSGISELFENNFLSQFYNSNNNLFKRIILDVGFHLFFKGVLLSLILAVFIFSYFDYRKNEKNRIQDDANKCFVCDINRDTFLKYKISFAKHVKNEHNLINYVHYIIYILTKNQKNISKIEKYVLDKYRSNDLTWIPCLDTRSLNEQIKQINEGKLKISKVL